MASVKTNFEYNLILTCCNYIFPLITYPYVSRVLGVNNIGICNFVDSIIQYFILFSALGVGSFGVREIARYKDNEKRKNEIFTNLICFNALMSVIAIIILVVCTFTLEPLIPYKNYLLLGILKIVFEVILTSWFFQGVSDFKYITMRSVAVRTLFVVTVFAFVRDQDDTLVYYFLLCMTVVINALINWRHGIKMRQLNFKYLKLSKYILPILSFGGYLLLTSMYTTFNTMFLGFVSGTEEVGYFTTATKLYSLFLSVFTAFTTVMVPKVSELLRKGELDKLSSIAKDTFELVFMCTIPIIAICEVYYHEIVYIVSGAGYEGAELPFRIVIFLLLIIGMEQIVIQQFLMASTSNKAIVTVSIIGASVGVIANLLFTPVLASTGSAISWGMSELIVLMVGLVLVKKIIGIKVKYSLIANSLLIYGVYYLFNNICKYSIHNAYESLVVSVCVTGILFIVINTYFARNKFVVEVIRKLAGNKLIEK